MTIKVHTQSLAPLGSLVGAAYNPREMSDAERDKLKRSILEWGVVEPLVARREDRLILGGHQRAGAITAILLESGMSAAQVAEYPVPVVFLDGITDERAKLLNVALNKIHGEWDYGKLADLFASLRAVGDLDPADIALSGFTASDIDEIVGLAGADVDPPPTGEDVDDVDDALAARARKFGPFELTTDADAAEVRAALVAYGWTGPGNAAAALLAALRAACAALATGQAQAPQAPKPRRSKTSAKGPKE